MDDRKCPACSAPMIESPEARDAWGCSKCGGVWAGSGFSDQVSALDPSVRELAAATDKNAELRRSRMPSPDSDRKCPECRVQLTWREMAGVEVDVCSVHGTWFDRGELQRIVDLRMGKKPSSAKLAAAPVASGEPVTSDIALGAVGLFLSILPPRM